MNKNDLRIKSVERNVSYAQAGIHEEGHNGGDFINKVEEIWGMNNEPYCAMGQFWNFGITWLILSGVDVQENNASSLLKKYKSAICSDTLTFDPAVIKMVEAAKKRKQYIEFKNASVLKKGDFVIFNFGTDKIPAYHIEQFSHLHGEHIVTVGWNTSAENSTAGNDPTGGGGIFVKERSLEKIIGIISW